MGSRIQMPGHGSLWAEHRRLIKKNGVEWAVHKTSDNDWSFSNGSITGKPDMSAFWVIGSPPGTTGFEAGGWTGLVRLANPHEDQSLVVDDFVCFVQVQASDGGLGGSYPIIPALMSDPGDARRLSSPMYVPTTNELWYVANSLGSVGQGVFDTFLGPSGGYAQILKFNADSDITSSTLVHAEFQDTYSSTFSGSAYDACSLRLMYDHVRDCVWAFTRNNDVNENTPPGTIGNVRNTGYVGLMKFSTSGALLQTIKFIEWTDEPHSASYVGLEWNHGLQNYYNIGHDGLMWFGTAWSDASNTYSSDVNGNSYVMKSYNPDTGQLTAHFLDHRWISESPAFMPDGRLLLVKGGSGSYAEDWFLADPASGDVEQIMMPMGLPTGNQFPFGAQPWTSPDTANPGIFVAEYPPGGSASPEIFYQLFPGHFGLTVTSADFRSFEKPWKTTADPIYTTEYGEVHRARYGPFQDGDHVRVGLLYQQEADGLDEPAPASLCINTVNGPWAHVMSGESNVYAYWTLEEDGSYRIDWRHPEMWWESIAETILSPVNQAAELPSSPVLNDTTIRVVTLDEVVPVIVTAEVPVELNGADGCPDDSQGLSFASTAPVVGGRNEGPQE